MAAFVRIYLIGFLVDSQSSGAAKDYTSAFLLLGGLLLLNLIVTSWSLKISYTNEGGMVLSDILRYVCLELFLELTLKREIHINKKSL